MLDEYKRFATEFYFTTSDGVQLHIAEAGQGKPLIILSGWSSNSSYFFFNFEELSKNYHVYILDYRSHGESQVTRKGYRISRLAKDAREFFESLGVEKASWMGHSMGCSVLWCYYDMYGNEDVEKFVFVDEPPFLYANPYDTEDEIAQYGGNHIDAWNIAHALEIDWGNGMKAFEKYFSSALYAPYENIENLMLVPGIADAPNTEQAYFMSRLLIDHLQQDWRDVIPTIDVPVLYIMGEISHATTTENADWIASRVKNVTVERFGKEDYGTHNLMINSPERFNALVSEFLA